MRKQLTLLFVAVLTVPCLGVDVNDPPVGLDVDDPPLGVFADEWYAVMLAGSKSGHMHSVMERVKREGGDVIRTRSEMTMVAGRGDGGLTVKMTQETEESLAGDPLKFSSRLSLGKIPTATEGRFADGKVTIVTRQFGIATDKKTYTIPKGARMSWGLYREQLDRGLKPGTKYDLSLYDPTIAPDKLTTAKVEIFDKEQLDLFGRKVEAIRSRQTLTIPGLFGKEMELATTMWLTDEGDPVRMQMSIMDIPVEMVACPKAVALAKDEPADIMGNTLITVDGPIDREASRLTFRLRWNVQNKPAELPETGMQKIVSREDGTITLTNTRRSARPAKGAGPPLSQEERARHLASTSVLNHKDPEVARLAKQAAGNEKDPVKLADKLQRFVGEYVQTKNLNVGFATAGEVARSKEGDCTEHGVLLAALGRAVGIPTRIATGFVYTDEFLGRPHVFVGHLWTQFYIDGEWVDLDAALHQTDVDPTHIALALSDTAEGGIADLAGSIWITMGKPQITLIKEVETRPAQSR